MWSRGPVVWFCECVPSWRFRFEITALAGKVRALIGGADSEEEGDDDDHGDSI